MPSGGDPAQVPAGSTLRFGEGARVWLNEICERDQVDLTAALFSEATVRVIVSVGREDDVKLVGLRDARVTPFLRIALTDASGRLEIQDLATWSIEELRNSHSATIPEVFGWSAFINFSKFLFL